MRVAYLSPLPPARTGIAHYSSMLLPALRERVEIVERGNEDVALYHLGNNPHHEWIYNEAMKTPGVVVLHDVVLHHLIVEMTLARGNADGYARALHANHGAAGEAWARGRAAGLHSEMGNFLFPASIEVANRSRAVIVHNVWARDLLLSHGVTTPVHVVGHPVAGAQKAVRSAQKRAGVFGFLTSAKRGEVILEAASRAGVELLVVGEAAPNIDASRFRATGYVADEDFDRYYDEVDRIVNLRYPSAGETSGTLIRAFQMGKPVAVSDYAQFAELPDECAVKIPLGDGEVDALVEFFKRDFDTEAIAKAQRAWLEENAALEKTVAGYIAALCGPDIPVWPPAGQTRMSGPLFPELAVVAREANQLTLRNTGDFTLLTRVYGQPSYRLIAKLFDGPREIANAWLQLPRDLQPGGETTITIPHKANAELRLYHAIEGIPMLEPEAWYAAAL